MKSPGRMPVSDMIPHRIFPSNPDACHPNTYLSFLRSSSKGKHEDGRMDAIEVDDGWSLRRKRSAQKQRKKMEKLGARSKNEGAGIYLPNSLPLYPLM
jgi:hypothetical protein